MPHIPLYHRVLRKALYHRSYLDRTLCRLLLHRRIQLPELSLSALFEDFSRQAVTFTDLPRGNWSTPVMDLVMLLKLAVCTHPRRLMEIGSFRGFTALLLAQHTAADARIVTVDSYPDHGEAYRDTPLAAKIERRVGGTSPDLFAQDAPKSYDFIFVDADHSYDGARRDTELALPLLADDGFIIWHDYANWGYFNGHNGVPEYLADLVTDGLPIAHVAGSDCALHSPAWKTDPGRAAFQRALVHAPQGKAGENPWHTAAFRG